MPKVRLRKAFESLEDYSLICRASGSADPPREDVAEAIATCRGRDKSEDDQATMGLQLRPSPMRLDSDHHQVLAGDEIDALDEELEAEVEGANVFAR